MKGIACYLPAWEFMLSLFHNSISCGHPRKSLFWISQIKVTWTNSRISEFPLEKALSTAMSCLWLKCFCCLLQFVRNKQGRGFQCKQIKHKVCQCSIYFEWNTCGFAWFCCAIQGRKCLWHIFVMCICKAIQLYFPASNFHSAHKLWMGRYKQGVLCFSRCCLEDVLLANALSQVQYWGSERVLFKCTGIAGQPQPCLKIKHVRDRSTPHFPG